MYTLHHESTEDDHYQDFLRTVEFLDPAARESGGLRRLLDDYRQALYRIESGTDALVRVKEKIEAQLRRVMSRTERLRVSTEADGMLREQPAAGLELTEADVRDYLALEKIGRRVRQGRVLDYWKSAPYLLSFMEEYKLKKRVMASLHGSPDDDLPRLLANGERASLSWDEVEAYGRLDPANARLRSLLASMESCGAWKLLWLPPSLPYYAQSDPWRTAHKEQFSKRLIFSTWRVVPKAVASVASYDAERRIFSRFDDSIRNTPEERRKRRPLLRFAYSAERDSQENDSQEGNTANATRRYPTNGLTGMPVLGILYPSPSLAEAGDPVQLGHGATLEDAVARARQQIEQRLAAIIGPDEDQAARPSSGSDSSRATREDESWYWAAPILLDLERYGQSTKEWFRRADLPTRWTGEIVDEDRESRWADHVGEARKLVDMGLAAAVTGSLKFGRPPNDLAEALAVRSVAGPATSALRALTRATGTDTPTAIAARDAAARIAWSFRTLFNLPEAMALIRGSRAKGGGTPYWRQVVDYCAAGNLQAVLDEYVHTLRDLEGLFGVDNERAWARLAAAVSAALSLRTGAPHVDEFRSAGETIEVKHRRMRNHFAMRFGSQETDDGRSGAREGQVRRAFNSPFWPFVLASTSVGQEGLDFHVYCHAVMHWNLPSNPVDLEQREGRVHRYKGHAVRKNIATKHGAAVLGRGSTDVWHDMFEAARRESEAGNGLVPYWLFSLEDGAYIERHVPALPLSRDASQLQALKRSLAVYRMVFGQPRQDDLVAFLLERVPRDERQEIEPLLRIDLSPPHAGHR